jgi:hypothetical protein
VLFFRGEEFFTKKIFQKKCHIENLHISFFGFTINGRVKFWSKYCKTFVSHFYLIKDYFIFRVQLSDSNYLYAKLFCIAAKIQKKKISKSRISKSRIDMQCHCVSHNHKWGHGDEIQKLQRK